MMKFFSIKSFPFRLIPFLLILSAVVACQKDGCAHKRPDPTTKEGIYKTYMASLPSSVNFFYVAESFAKIPKEFPLGESMAEEISPTAIFHKLSSKIGFDLADTARLKQVAIAPEKGLLAAVLNGQKTTLMFYSSDLAKTKATLVPVWRRASLGDIDSEKPTNAKEAQPGADVKEVKGEGGTFYVAGKQGQQIGWFFQGNKVTVVLDSAHTNTYPDEETGGVEGELKSLSTLTAESPDSFLKLQEGVVYKDFMSQVGLPSDYAYYGKPNSTAIFYKGVTPKVDPSLYNRMLSGITFLAIGASHLDGREEVRGFAGIEKDRQDLYGRLLKKDSGINFLPYASEDLILGVKFSVDPAAFASWVDKVFTKENQEDLSNALKYLSQEISLDFKKEILNQLSGDAALLFYGLKGNPLNMMTGGGADISKEVEIGLLVNFKGSEALTKLVDFLKEVAERKPDTGDAGDIGEEPSKAPNSLQKLGITVQDIADADIKRIDILKLGMTGYAKGGTLYLTSLGIPPQKAVAQLLGEKVEKGLGDDPALDVGKNFVEKTSSANSFYLNVKRLEQNLRPMKMMMTMMLTGKDRFFQFLEGVEEVGGQVSFQQGGFLLVVETDLNPRGAKR